MDAERFTGDLQRSMEQALSQFDANLPGNPKVWLRVYGKNRLVVTPYEAQAEPAQRCRNEIGRRWPMTGLRRAQGNRSQGEPDEAFRSLGTREFGREACNTVNCCASTALTNRGSNAWCQAAAVSATGNVLYTRPIEKSTPCGKIRRVVNATLASRGSHVWGEGTTACEADQQVFGATRT